MVSLWVEGTSPPPPPGFWLFHVACPGHGMKQKRKAASSKPTSEVALGGFAGPVRFHRHPEGLLWCSRCFFSLGPEGAEPLADPQACREPQSAAAGPAFKLKHRPERTLFQPPFGMVD
ncbi:uncharacterized protein FAM215A-like [Symphalangus syndactylus]|uniref:uncharacterized protein FAM215A-like n=1 Tax=Symphalangus syndactylus TaxID=9590 RepID=UPI0024412648|nr:uncharacterized protein FAM215A-like [Symphalangus syndactylus]